VLSYKTVNINGCMVTLGAITDGRARGSGDLFGDK